MRMSSRISRRYSPRAPCRDRRARSSLLRSHEPEVGVLERAGDDARAVDPLALGDEPRDEVGDVLAAGVGVALRAARGLDLDAARRRRGRPARPRRSSVPRSTMTTRSQTSSTSDSRCEFSSTATPRSRRPSSSSRTVRRPAGSSALVGSSSSTSRGSPMSACAMPRRCCIPFDIASTRRPAACAQLDEREQPRALLRAAVRAREALVQDEHLVGGRPAGEAKELGEVAGLRAGGLAAARVAEDLDVPAGRLDEPAGDLRERRLAGAVGPEQPDELTRADAQVDARERDRRAVGLAQPGDVERVGHAGEDDAKLLRSCRVRCADRVLFRRSSPGTIDGRDRGGVEAAHRRAARREQPAHGAHRRVPRTQRRRAAGQRVGLERDRAALDRNEQSRSKTCACTSRRRRT